MLRGSKIVIMVILDFFEIVASRIIEFQSKLTGLSCGFIFECTIFILFVLSLATIFFLARKKFNGLLKKLLAIFCAFVLLITAFIGLLRIDGYRLMWGAESFVQDSIFVLNNGTLPPISLNITEEEKKQMRTLASNLPREDYQIEFSDSFGDLWEFYIEFENGDTYFCAVDAPNTFLRLFAKTDYKLYNLRKEEN